MASVMQQQTLASAIHSVLSAAAEQICGLVERTVTEYEDRDVSSKLQIETQRRILDELLKPRVTLHRAVISETTTSDSWNSASTRRLSSALSVLGRDCNGRPGRRKDSCSSSSSSSSQGELHPEGLTSSAEQQLRASHRPPEPPVDIPSLSPTLRASACKQYRGHGRPEKASSETDTADSGSRSSSPPPAVAAGAAKSKSPSLANAAAAPVVKPKESLPHPFSLLPCHVTVQDFMESTPVDAMMDRGEAGQMMMKKKKKPCDRFSPIQTKKHAKLDTSAEQTSDRSRHVVGNPKSTPPTGSDDSVRIRQQPSCYGRGQFYTERLRRTERQPPADNIPSAPLTRSSSTTSSREKYRRQPGGVRPKKASFDAAGSRWRLRPSGVAAGNAAAAGSNAVAKPATLAALAARGWRGMKLGGGRRRVRVRDHTVLHPSLLSLCHVTIKDIMERSMALAREAGWKRKKWYPPPPHNRSWATRAKAKKDTTPDASDSRDSQASSDTAMDRELHQHLQQMFEEDDNEEDFLGFSASDEETSVQKDVEDGQPSDRGSPDSNLTPTTMVSYISETTSASRDSGILAKDSNAEPGGSMDSRSVSSSSTRGDLCAEGLTGAGKQLPAESPTEVVMMTPQPSSALSMDSSVLAKDSKSEPGGSKDSLTSSAQGELYSEATHPPPVEVMAVHPPPALIVDFSILEKYSIKPGGSEEDSQPLSSPGAPLFSEGLTHTEQLPAESAADIPSASFVRRASDGRYLPRNPSPHFECLELRGRRRKTPAAAAVSVHSVTIPDIPERSMEDLAREAAEIKKKVLDRQASDLHLEGLTAPLVKRSRLAIEDKEGGGVAVDGSISKMEYFDDSESDSDEERTQAKVTMALAALSTSMDVLQTHDSQDNQSSSNTDFLHLPVCKEVVSTERQQRSPILVQEEPAPPPQSRGQREEEEELAKRPEEAHCSTLTLPAATSEDYNDNSWTEPLSSTSSETQDGGAPQPTGEGQPLGLRCSESDSDNSDEWEETGGGTSSTGRGKTRAEVEDSGASSHGTEDGGSEWEETREAPQAVKSLKSRGRHKLKGQRLSLSNNKSKMTFRGKTTCAVCGKRFRHRDNLNRHKRIHTGEKPFSCIICSASFNEKEHLHEHMVTMHTGNNPFGCTVCDRVFGLRSSLHLHMRTHTAIKRFSCTICDKSFRRKFALVGHMTSHMAKKGKRL